MKILEQLAETEPHAEWKPVGEMGKALKHQEGLLADLIRKGHSTRAIYEAWGFESDDQFGSFSTAMNGLRRFLKKEGSR